MNKVSVTDDASAPIDVPIRRRNTPGINTVAVTVTVPKELLEKLDKLVAKTTKSRSFVVVELIEKGLENNG